jgi:hypothetical protein
MALLAIVVAVLLLLARLPGSDPAPREAVRGSRVRPAAPAPATPAMGEPRPVEAEERGPVPGGNPGGDPPPGLPPREAEPPPAARPLRIHGRIVDSSGVGVGGAEFEVRAWSGKEPDLLWTTASGAASPDGTFEADLDPALAALGFGVETRAEGFLEGWVSVEAADYDEERGIEVPVEPARSVAGRVVDGYALPIPGTVVQLWYGSETTWPTPAAADGRFRTPARAPRKAFDLIVEAPGYPRRVMPLPAAPGEESTDVGDLVFRRGGRLAGIVVDPGGRPVADLPLLLANIAGSPPGAPRARTDGGGRFEFTDLGEGMVGVIVDEPATALDSAGNGRRWRGGPGDDVPVGRTDVRVVVVAETTIVLRFVDAATGDPLLVTSSVSLIRPSGSPEPEGSPGRTSSSSPYGSERRTVLPGVRYDVLVKSPGFEDARLPGIDVPDVAEATVDVPLRRRP